MLMLVSKNVYRSEIVHVAHQWNHLVVYTVITLEVVSLKRSVLMMVDIPLLSMIDEISMSVLMTVRTTVNSDYTLTIQRKMYASRNVLREHTQT